MTKKYILQVKNETKKLIKSFGCSDLSLEEIEKYKTNANINNRKQVVVENTELFNEIISVYEKHNVNAKFTIDEKINEISWVIEFL